MRLPYGSRDWLTGRVIIILLCLFKSGHCQQNSSLTFQRSTAKCKTPDDFPCRCSDICISRSKWQDGQIDCPDGSDEECLEWQYDCKFGKPRCISLYSFMDGVIDCASGFDEGCPAHYFVCADHSDCIDPRKYLDGAKDFHDGSDEPCPQASFLCRDGSKCVTLNKFQDGKPDCPDASDEECTLFQFECFCGKPRCIDIRLYNDSKTDCEDGSDEPINVDRLLASSHCPDGSSLRIEALKHRTTPPPGAPMVPCKPEDSSKCRGDLNEICLIIAGSPRCTCQTSHVRPPGSTKCIPSPTLPFSRRPTSTTEIKTTTIASSSTQIKTTSHTPFFIFATSTASTKAPIFEKQTSIQFSNDETTTKPTLLPVLKGNENETSLSLSKINCSLDDPRSCPGHNEVCVKTQNVQGCVCDAGFSRSPTTGICSKLQDECGDESLNDCDPNAICMDNPISYECLCHEGYLDMSAQPQTTPGRHCVPLVNECSDSRTHDCDPNADCLDLPKGYTCRCKGDFSDVSANPNRQPGRKCAKDKSECLNKTDNDCSPFTSCTDLQNGYRCRCRCNDGFFDASTSNKSGTICKQNYRIIMTPNQPSMVENSLLARRGSRNPLIPPRFNPMIAPRANPPPQYQPITGAQTAGRVPLLPIGNPPTTDRTNNDPTQPMIQQTINPLGINVRDLIQQDSDQNYVAAEDINMVPKAFFLLIFNIRFILQSVSEGRLTSFEEKWLAFVFWKNMSVMGRGIWRRQADLMSRRQGEQIKPQLFYMNRLIKSLKKPYRRLANMDLVEVMWNRLTQKEQEFWNMCRSKDLMLIKHTIRHRLYTVLPTVFMHTTNPGSSLVPKIIIRFDL